MSVAEPDPIGATTAFDARGGALDEPRTPVISPEERAAALRAGAPKVPRRVVVWGLAVAAILAIGGTIGERIVSSVGLNPPSVTTTTTTAAPTGGPSPASALLSFVALHPLRAPRVILTDQSGRAVSLAGERGKVVVLTFFNASCADVCPVIAAELRRADGALGVLRSHVEFLTVNTDPLDLAAVPVPPAVTATGLGSLPNWHYLTGSLGTLNAVWKDFGVSISVYKDSKVVVHNDVLYLVSPNGELVSRGSPFSDESRRGVYRLPRALERIAAGALVSAIAALLGPRR